jgi:hypothetical protein
MSTHGIRRLQAVEEVNQESMERKKPMAEWSSAPATAAVIPAASITGRAPLGNTPNPEMTGPGMVVIVGTHPPFTWILYGGRWNLADKITHLAW